MQILDWRLSRIVVVGLMVMNAIESHGMIQSVKTHHNKTTLPETNLAPENGGFD